MKILMINKFLHQHGGSETYIIKLGEYLKEKGHEVELFGMEHPERCVENTIGEYTSYMDFHSASLFEKISYSLKTIYSMESRRKIRRVLESFEPDVCHLNNINFQLTPSIILEIDSWRKRTGKQCRIVSTAHDYQWICPNHMLNNPKTKTNCEKCIGGRFYHCVAGKCIHNSLLKSVVGTIEAYLWNLADVYSKVDAIVCCSRFLKDKLDTNPVLKGKTVAIHNFTDKIAFRQTAKKDYVLYFGRFSDEKGIKILVEVCKSLPHIPFVFAGKGPLEGMLQNAPNITNVGFLPREELEVLVREARFSVYPSEWYENCPFSVIESQMYATPVVASDIGGIPELIKENVTGVLFEAGNAERLRECILSLWEDRQKTDAMSKECKNLEFDTVEDYYSKIYRIYLGD